ncbi:MAG: MFS transporter [Bacteroidales bacterium]|nr:MFS transporter [Bacteroidales bacterium]
MKPQVNPNRILFVLCMASFLVPFMGSAINLALPVISEELSLKSIAITWILTSYLITTAIFQMPLARLSDLIGRRRVFILGVLIFSVTSCLCGFSTSGEMLIVFRALSGIGSAMMFGTNMAILTSIFPSHQRGKALGITTAVVYASIASGPFLGGLITHYLGWQSIFFVSALAGLLVVVCALIFLDEEWIVSKGEKFDWLGSFAYGIALFGLIFGFTKLPSIAGVVWIATGGICFWLFTLQESRCKFPLFNMQLFKHNKVFVSSSSAALINYAATFAIGFIISLYLQYIRGFDAQQAGLILVIQAVVQAIVAFFSGSLSDRISPSKLSTAGMFIIVVGLTGLLFLSIATPLWVIVTLLIIMGLGFGVFSSPNTNVIMSSVEKKHYGQASATTGTVRLIGQTLSMGIASMVISLKIGNQKITPDIYPQFMESIRIMFLVFIVLCIVGVFASMVSRKNEF